MRKAEAEVLKEKLEKAEKRITAANNRLEYLLDKVGRQRKEIIGLKAGAAQLQDASGILMAKVAIAYGTGDDHMVRISREEVDLEKLDVQVEMSDDAITIRCRKKEGA